MYDYKNEGLNMVRAELERKCRETYDIACKSDGVHMKKYKLNFDEVCEKLADIQDLMKEL